MWYNSLYNLIVALCKKEKVMEAKKIIYSGIQPSGVITLGNYVGAISNWLELQKSEDTQCIYSIVDMHSLTVRQDPAELRKRTLSFFAQYLACGLDPDKNIMYIQSHVSEHAELCWILNCFTYVGEASRMTQFKEKSAKHADNVNMGLMDYPILMAADILLYNTSLVPIGIDQKQHLEIARDIAARFNNIYGNVFTVPEGYIPTTGAKVMSLQDPTSKMSKSDPDENATIMLIDDNDAIRRKIKRAVTDSDSRVYLSDEKPGIKNLLTIYASCNGISLEDAEKACTDMNYGTFKTAVADSVVNVLEPIRKSYLDIVGDKEYIMKVAREGAERAKSIAFRTMRKVYKKVGFVER